MRTVLKLFEISALLFAIMALFTSQVDWAVLFYVLAIHMRLQWQELS